MRKNAYRPWPPKGPPCPHPMGDGLWRCIGCVFIGVGLLLLLLCIPGWAWAALCGAALICAGWLLLSTCRR